MGDGIIPYLGHSFRELNCENNGAMVNTEMAAGCVNGLGVHMFD